MDEEDFDSLRQWRPFGTEDARQAMDLFGRGASLAIALWGRTPDDLQRQLLAPHPEIPSGFDLADFQQLERHVQLISSHLKDPQYARLNAWANSPSTIIVGTQRFTGWEARCEILRRAIDYLERQ